MPFRHLLKRLLLHDLPLVRLNLARQRSVHLCLRPKDAGDRASFFENFFELPLNLSLDREPSLIADAGAHIGCFSLYAHSRWPNARVVAFEPDEKNQALLRENFSLNKIEGEVVPKAIWKEPGKLTFAANQSNSGYLTAGTKQGQCSGSKIAREIDATSLSFSFGSDLKKIDLLKLDIEGAELEVLDVELPNCSPHTIILCELHFTEINRARFDEILSRHGWVAVLHDATHPPHSTWILRHA